MLRGTSLHLERELEIQTKVTIECKTREDSYGVRLLNMIQGINGLLTWNKPNERYITREMPVRNFIKIKLMLRFSLAFRFLEICMVVNYIFVV
jgi:hypothetical protein